MTNNKSNKPAENQEQDRHLQSPGEANRDKHINFVALESGDPDPADEDDSNLRLKDDSTSQTREVKDKDNRMDVNRDRNIDITEDDLRDAKADKLTGRDPRDNFPDQPVK